MTGWTILCLLALAAVCGLLGFGDRNDGRVAFWGLAAILAAIAFAILIGANILRLM